MSAYLTILFVCKIGIVKNSAVLDDAAARVCTRRNIGTSSCGHSNASINSCSIAAAHLTIADILQPGKMGKICCILVVAWGSSPAYQADTNSQAHPLQSGPIQMDSTSRGQRIPAFWWLTSTSKLHQALPHNPIH